MFGQVEVDDPALRQDGGEFARLVGAADKDQL